MTKVADKKQEILLKIQLEEMWMTIYRTACLNLYVHDFFFFFKTFSYFFLICFKNNGNLGSETDITYIDTPKTYKNTICLTY